MAAKKTTKKSATKKVSPENAVSQNDDSKLFAFLAVFLSIVGFIIALLTKKEDNYVMFYAKQSLVLFITCIIAQVVIVILAITIIGIVLIPFLWLFLAILWILQIVYSLSGEMKSTPIIGQFADKFNL